MKIIRGEKGFKRRGKSFVDIIFFPSRVNIKRPSLINKIRGGSRNKRNAALREEDIYIYIYFGSMNMNISSNLEYLIATRSEIRVN